MGEALKDAIVVDTEQVRGHLDEVVRSTVEQTLNQLLDQEADRVAGAGKYERNPERMDTRAGSYRRKLQTKAGEVELKVTRLRKLPLETAIIERYKRRESSVEEALIEMYLAGCRCGGSKTSPRRRGPGGRDLQPGQRADHARAGYRRRRRVRDHLQLPGLRPGREPHG